LPLDPIFQPVKWLPDWLTQWAIRLVERRLERREAPRRMVANLTANYWEGTGAAGHSVRDISTSGAFIAADFKWIPGTILTMTLHWEGQVAGSGSPAAEGGWRSVSLCRQTGAKEGSEFSAECPGCSSVVTLYVN
jgi:hypothetical protein